MGKKNQRRGVVASRTRNADETWNREAGLGGVREVHMKFFVHDEADQIPHDCPRVQPDWKEMGRRELQHELARGDQFIKNVPGVNPSGLGRKLIESGFGFDKFQWYVKDTLHTTSDEGKNRKAVVECIFSRKPEGKPMEWRDTKLNWYLRTVWRVHAYNNPGGIMTINFVHPANGRAAASRVFQVDGETIKIVPVG